MKKGIKVLTAATVLAAGVSWYAHAASINNPTQSWTVGPINARSSSGAAYCSMKNEYAGGHSLVFAQDSKGVRSIALDFGHKNILTAGKQYRVVAEVGYLTRDITAIAATKGVLIMQMGKDEAFYDEIRQKDILQISFADQSLTFGLKGSSDALDALDGCANGLSMTGHPVEAVQQQELAAAPQPRGLKAELDRLRAENSRLLEATQKISDQLQEVANAVPQVPDTSLVDTMVAEFKQKEKMWEAKNAALQNTVNNLQQKTASLSAENDALKLDIAAAQTKLSDKDNLIASLQDKEKTLTAENKNLHQELDAVRNSYKELSQNDSADKEIIALKEKQNTLVKENTQLKADLADTRASKPVAKEQIAVADKKKLEKILVNIEPAAGTADITAKPSQWAAAEKPAPAPVVKPVQQKQDTPQLETAAVAVAATSQTVSAQPAMLPGLLQMAKITAHIDRGGYSWQSAGVSGSAREVSGASVTEAAEKYTDDAKKNCAGDFASTFSSPQKVGKMTVMQGEIACIGDKSGDHAAALLFTLRDGHVAVLSHEGPAEKMETALEKRDAVLGSFSNI